MSQCRLTTDARIIWAITTKDIWEAVRNKNALTVVVTSLLLVVFYWALPMLRTTLRRCRCASTTRATQPSWP